MWHVGGCGICGVVGKMTKDVGTAIRKSSYCGVVSTLFGYFLGIPSLHGIYNNLPNFCDFNMPFTTVANT